MSVYFIKVGRYLKVGFSENPERRCKNLWRSSTRYSRPWDLALDAPRELLLTIDGDKTTEYHVHQSLDMFAARCEWFIDEPEVRDFMAHLARGGAMREVQRPAGQFRPVPHQQMLPERRVEMDQWLAKRGKRDGGWVDFGDGDLTDEPNKADPETAAHIQAALAKAFAQVWPNGRPESAA